jgi:Domain of unknown function (DUF4153)
MGVVMENSSPQSHREVDIGTASFGPLQFLAVLLLVALADLTIFRGKGYAGYAALFAAGPLLMVPAALRPRWRFVLPITVLAVLLAVRLAWWGSPLGVGLGFALQAAFAMALSGLPPYLMEGVAFIAQTFGAGYVAIYRQWQRANRVSPTVSGAGSMAVVLPVVAFAAFGLLFVLANPDLATALGEQFERFARAAREWLADFAPNVTEALFCLAAFWILCGALRPLTASSLLEEKPPQVGGAASPVFSEPAPLYPAFRNTLLTVIALFAVYLVFEFQTLWFREFPSGFYYSGYAHEGAFWLTVALGLTTLWLSLVFRGRILDDPRQPRLRRLAWVWSLENLLLAAAVYHRLLIYVGFNGMTRMRVVGFCGISAVVVGFLLVLWKILAHRDFVWLVRRQLWALFLFVYLYAVLPVDALVMRYNVERILNGDPAPSVQISVHPIDPDGLLQLVPLLECDNAVIREGVRALLGEHWDKSRLRERQRDSDGWTAFQAAERELLERLEELEPRLRFANRTRRDAAWKRFRDYAYQWY